MRDPLASADLSARRALLFTAIAVASLVGFALLRPSAFWTLMVIVAFLVMIMLHELGHFVTAKWTGMKASEFFVGFGPRIWSVRRGETEYGLKAIPLGGYVKILGMTNLEDVPPADEPRTYRAKHYGPKLLVASAGSLMHFLIAGALMFTVLFFAGDLRNDFAVPVVDEVATDIVNGVPVGPAAAAGILAGDEVVEVAGEPVGDWEDLVRVVSERPDQTVDFVVVRDGETLVISVELAGAHPLTGEARGYAGIAPTVVVPPMSAFDAAVATPGEIWDVTTASVVALGSIFSPSGIAEYVDTITGANEGQPEEDQRFISPVGFGRVANQAVNSGWVSTFVLLILINVFVGLFNLVPLLPFDGGHIAIATYEAIASRIRRRKIVVDVNKLVPLTVVVIGVLGFIFLSSLFLDITRPVENPF